jgi:hypothetical protein
VVWRTIAHDVAGIICVHSQNASRARTPKRVTSQNGTRRRDKRERGERERERDGEVEGRGERRGERGIERERSGIVGGEVRIKISPGRCVR